MPASTSRASDPTILAALRDGELEVLGRLPGSTNQALVVLVRPAPRGVAGPAGAAGPECAARPTGVAGPAEPFHAVYKVGAAERPLFDFPFGTLARREVAAFHVSETLGWGIVPPTVLRDGPFGEGMVQQWITVDETVDVADLVVAADPRLRRMAVFDALVNNTDRKGGHILPVPGGHLHGVDHGVTFSVEPKLRTVLWGWIGTPFEADELDGIRRVREALDAELGRALGELLAPAEITATRRRASTLLRTGRFPRPRADWPAVPWPPF